MDVSPERLEVVGSFAQRMKERMAPCKKSLTLTAAAACLWQWQQWSSP
jgi:hypothetical protein